MEGKAHFRIHTVNPTMHVPYWGRLITDRHHKALPLIVFVFMYIQFRMLMALYRVNNITILTE